MTIHSSVALKSVASFLKERPSLKERLATGKALRQRVPRAAQSQLILPARRSSPTALLQKQALTRNPELVPIRYSRMLQSPFAFFRGSAAIMAMDLANCPRTDILVQLCGDMHLANFGFFGTNEHRLVFGINDFDETLPGSWEWDLKRLVASAVIASRSLGADQVDTESVVRTIVASYQKHMRNYAQMGFYTLSHQFIDEKTIMRTIKQEHLPPSIVRHLSDFIKKSRKSDNLQVFAKLTELVNKDRKLIDQPPLITHHSMTRKGIPLDEFINSGIISYRKSLLTDRRELLERYRLLDVARKIVGVGSVGRGCWVLYFEGLNQSDPLFLQYKQAEESVLSPYLGASVYPTQGHRVVAGQRLLQGAPDMLLGYGDVPGLNFYVRQLRDMKGGIRIGEGGIGVNELQSYGVLFGMALALGHARSGDPALISGYMGRSEQLADALHQFALAYAEQNDKDFEHFSLAVKHKKLPVSTEDVLR